MSFPGPDGRSVTITIGDPSPRRSTYPTGLVRSSPGGRIMSIATTNNGRRVYAATLRAGVWRSDDGGDHWQQMGRPQPGDSASQACPTGVAAPCTLPSPFVADVAVSPTDPDLVFAASALDTSRTERDGIYRSADGGQTWQLAHQFSCTGISPWRNHPPASQLMFAPDDPTKLWAAGGCTVAYSMVSGSPADVSGPAVTREQIGQPSTWHDAPSPNSQPIWHVAVGRNTASGARPVYACGPRQLWVSGDGGQTLRADTGIGDTGGSASTIAGCDMPGLQAGGAAGASVLAIDPTDQNHVYLAVAGGFNGRVYFDGTDCDGRGGGACRNPDGNICGSGGLTGCGEGSLWSATVQSSGGFAWRHEPSPPAYWGAGSLSGSVTVMVHPRPRGGYLLLFTDRDTVNVSVGAPTADGWYRLDGPNASKICARGSSTSTCNGGNTYPHDSGDRLLHMDPHPVAVDATFDLTLRAPAASVPAAYRHNQELASCGGGTIFLGNDGGFNRSSDCGGSFQQAENLETLIAGELAGIPRASGMPALYFGGPDNDPYFSGDGGSHWGVGTELCGDCQGFYTDARQTDYVVHQVRGPRVMVYQSTVAGQAPDASNPATRVSTFDLPTGICPDATMGCAMEMIYAAPGPVIQSLATEAVPSTPDLFWPSMNASGVTKLMRHQTLGFGIGLWLQEGPDLPSRSVYVVAQASGGHDRPVYYVADRDGMQPWDQMNHLWRSHRGADGGIDGWACIVPGPATAGVADGNCAAAPSSTAADDTISCAAGRACRAWNFAANPYDPQVVYISDQDGIKISTDGGQTWRIDSTLDNWLTAGHTIGPDCKYMCNYTDTVLRFSGMTFVPGEPDVRFAVGEAGVFMTTNAVSGGSRGSETWHRLWDSASMACEPGIPFFAPRTDYGRSLYVPCHGRSLLSFHGIPAAGGLSNRLDTSMVVGLPQNVSSVSGNGLLLPPIAPPPTVAPPTQEVGPMEEPGEKEPELKPELSVSVKASALHSSYDGPCPPPAGKAPTFTAVISVSDGPVDVAYQWLTSNGGSSDPSLKTIEFEKSGPQQATVTFTQSGYLPGQSVKDWVALYVRGPEAVESNHVNYTITCS